MLLTDSNQRQERLLGCLEEMAISCFDEQEINKMVMRFQDIYSNDFRHMYSSFFPFIVKISQNEQEYTLDYLTANLIAVQSVVEEKYAADNKSFEYLYKSLTKLTDHINLEIARYNQSFINERKLLDMESKNRAMQDSLIVATENLVKAQAKVDSVQTEYIAVLSIFAAIIIAFSGGLTFIGSVLSGTKDAPVFKAMLFLLVCGLIISNVVFMMMYLVGKITGRNIYALCQTENCSCGVGGRPKCSGINRVRKRLPYIFWVNIILLILIVVDVLAWHFDMVYNFIPLV